MMSQVNETIRAAILGALNANNYVIDVEIHSYEKSNETFHVTGHYDINTWLGSDVSKGNFDITVDADLEILNLSLT